MNYKMNIIDLEEIIFINNAEYKHQELHNNRIFWERNNPFDNYDNKQFKIRYRFNKVTTRNIIDMLYNNLQRATKRSAALSPEIQVRILNRYILLCILCR